MLNKRYRILVSHPVYRPVAHMLVYQVLYITFGFIMYRVGNEFILTLTYPACCHCNIQGVFFSAYRRISTDLPWIPRVAMAFITIRTKNGKMVKILLDIQIESFPMVYVMPIYM